MKLVIIIDYEKEIWERCKIKKKDFSKKQSWFKQKFFSNSRGDDMIESLGKFIDEKIIWSKYGL